MLAIFQVISFIWLHPLNRGRRIAAVFQFFKWQFLFRASRSELLVSWIENVKILVGSGETGISGNVYAGLMEFADMGFVLHFCREEDHFYDVGGNVGAYSLIAGGVAGSHGFVFEPVPSTYDRLVRHIKINLLEDKVVTLNMGVGSERGALSFTTSHNCMNRVARSGESEDTVDVPVTPLDDYFIEGTKVVKIDVEGFEHEVLRGGAKIFSDSQTQVLIVELNGAGERYGYSDESVDALIREYGFMPVDYDPLNRVLTPLTQFRSGENTIYVRDFKFVNDRVRDASSAMIETVGRQRL